MKKMKVKHLYRLLYNYNSFFRCSRFERHNLCKFYDTIQFIVILKILSICKLYIIFDFKRNNKYNI